MAANYQGDFTTANTVYVLFNTFDSNDPSASVTLTGLAVTDIEIYKDGSVTQRSSDAGYTLLDTDGIDFDGTTGIHGFSIDLSDNTDAGFYAAGSEYAVVVASVTIDGATVNFVACTFSIERTGGALALLKAGVTIADGPHGGTSAVLTLERLVAASTTAGEPGIKTTGNTSGAGILSTGGATGPGASFQGGATSGAGLLAYANASNSNGVEFDGSGSGSGVFITGGPTGHGIFIIPGTTSGDGILFSITSGTGIRGDIVGDITGNLSGSVGSVTGAVGSVAAGGIIVGAFATDSITADALATDAVNEIRDGLLPTQNAAFNDIPFTFVAASDHVTPVTGATGTSATRSIDGGAFAAVTGTIAEVGNGSYSFDASAADMNGGKIQFRFIATGGTPGAPDDRFVTIVTGGGV